MNKFYSEVILLNQFYIMDNEKTIQNVIDNFSNNNKFEIKEYSIFVLGS
jgi:Translation elongation factor Ts